MSTSWRHHSICSCTVCRTHLENSSLLAILGAWAGRGCRDKLGSALFPAGSASTLLSPFNSCISTFLFDSFLFFPLNTETNWKRKERKESWSHRLETYISSSNIFHWQTIRWPKLPSLNSLCCCQMLINCGRLLVPSSRMCHSWFTAGAPHPSWLQIYLVFVDFVLLRHFTKGRLLGFNLQQELGGRMREGLMTNAVLVIAFGEGK